MSTSLPPAALFMDDITFSPPFTERAKAPGTRAALVLPTLWIDDLIFSPPMPGAGATMNRARGFARAFGQQGNWIDDLIFSPPTPPIIQNIQNATVANDSSGLASVSAEEALTSRLALKSSANAKTRQAWVFAELACLVLIVSWLNVQFRFIPQASAQRIESHSVPTARDIEFGGKFKLRGLKLSKKADGLYLNAVWQSIGQQKLRYVNAIHIIDASGKTLSTTIYPQDTFNRSVAAGKIWEDKLYLRQDQLKNALRIGLSLYDPPDGLPLLANKGVTDGNNVRLLLAIP